MLGFVLDDLFQNLHIAHAFDVKVFVGSGGHLKGRQIAVLFRKTNGLHDAALDGLTMRRSVGDDANLTSKARARMEPPAKQFNQLSIFV